MTPHWKRALRASVAGPLCALLMHGTAHSAEPALEWSDLARAILCTGDMVRMDDHAVIYVVPEPAVAGEVRKRLYVGHVQDMESAGKPQAFYRGPLAKDWTNPRVPLGEKKSLTHGSLRYWINGKGSDLDSPGQNGTVEIDLRAKPPIVRSLARKPGALVQEVITPLEPQSLTPSNLAMIRGFTYQPIRSGGLVLRPFGIKIEGEYDSSPTKLHPNPTNPFFFAVSASDGGRCVIHALHKAPFWAFERVLEHPKLGMGAPTFLVEMIETYKPHDSRSASDLLHRRVHVRIGLDRMESKIIADRLYFDAEEGEYRQVKP